LSRDGGPSGVLVVDKPAGMTSHDVVDRVRRLFRTRRVGHCGTLDPDATGVLVLCLGNATRIVEYLASAAKHYRTDVLFGASTDTMDGSGAVLAERDATGLTEATLVGLLPRFRGRILQTPPMVSARHHQGRRLYELAREGVSVEREARPVEISELELVAFTPGGRACATLDVTCSTGTYIRVLADSLGEAAGTGAYMKSLRRTWAGADAATAFTLAEAHTLDALERAAASGPPEAPLQPIAAALRFMPQVVAEEEALRRLRNGHAIGVGEAAGGDAAPGTLAAILDEQGNVCAVARRESDSFRPLKVLAQS
jgi:tRNA pseudouridine55 synthase